jgi:hypothetical protein
MAAFFIAKLYIYSILKMSLFAVAESYGVQPGDESDKNHAARLGVATLRRSLVALAKEGCYVGISRDTRLSSRYALHTLIMLQEYYDRFELIKKRSKTGYQSIA